MNSKTLAWFTVIALLLTPTARAGDVVTDGTIGTAPSTTLTLEDLDGDTVFDTFNIVEALGERSGTNLFHSFLSFNIDSGEIALFSEDTAGTTTNVISRVTGGSASLLNGTIRNIPGANFWFVNTAGVMIGAGAVFDVSGALAIGAVDYVELSDGGRYYALPAGEDLSLLNVNPVDFGFLEPASAGALTITDLTLDDTVGTSAIGDMTFAGGSVAIAGSTIVNKPEASGGGIRIVGGSIVIDDSTLETQANAFDAGDIDITATAGDIFIHNGTIIRSSPAAADDVGSTGSIDITAASDVRVNVDASQTPMTDPRVALSSARSTNAGGVGDITLQGANVLVHRTDVTSRNGGQITIDADAGTQPGAGIVSLSDIDLDTSTTTDRNAGAISVTGNEVTISGTANLVTAVDRDSPGTGFAGAIDVSGRTSVVMQGDSPRSVTLDTSAFRPDSGGPGNISIRAGELGDGATGNLSLTNTWLFSFSQSATEPSLPGSISVLATGAIDLDTTDMTSTGQGNARSGDITIGGLDGGGAASIDLSNTFLRSDSGGLGDGGNITILATGNLTALNSGLTAEDRSAAPSQPGSVRLEGSSIFLDNSNISTFAFGSDPSSLELHALDTIDINGGRLFASVLGPGNGAGRGVLLQASRVNLVGTDIRSEYVENFPPEPTDRAGDIRILADTINVDATTLAASTRGAGRAGDIVLSGTDIAIDNGTEIRSTATAKGNIPPFDPTVDPQPPDASGPNLGSIGRAGDITITATNRVTSNLDSGGTPDPSLARVTIANSALNEDSKGPGTVTISSASGDVFLYNTSIESTTLSNLADGSIGTVTLEAMNGALTLHDVAVSASTSAAAGAGNVDIVSPTVGISASTLESSTSATGPGGVVRVNWPLQPATLGAVTIDSGTVLSARSTATGKAGSVFVAGDTIAVADATLRADATELDAQAGIVALLANNGISVTDSTLTATSSNVRSTTDGLNTGSIYLLDGFFAPGTGDIDIVDSTLTIDQLPNTPPNVQQDCPLPPCAPIVFPQGFLRLSTPGTVTLTSTDLLSRTTGTENAGDILIEASAFAMNGGSMETTTLDLGDAGTIWVAGFGNTTATPVAADTVRLTGGAVVRATAGVDDGSGDRFGDAGAVRIAAADVVLNGVTIESDQRGTASNTGLAGALEITAETLTLTDSFLSTTTASNNTSVAGGGRIGLTGTTQLQSNNSEVLASTTGAANAGTIDLQGAVLDVSGGRVESSTHASGRGGAVLVNWQFPDEPVQTGVTSISDGALLSASSTSSGRAGSVIVAGDTVTITDSTLQANATALGSIAGSVALVAENGISVTRSLLNATSRNLTQEAFLPGDGVGSIYLLNGLLQPKGGDITLVDSTLTIEQLSISTPPPPPCPNCSIVLLGTPGFLKLSTASAITASNTTLSSRATGDDSAGSVIIEAASFAMDAGAIKSSTEGRGSAGNISIVGPGSTLEAPVAIGAVAISNGANIQATAGIEGASTGAVYGSAGKIEILSNAAITLTGSASNPVEISSASFDGAGQAGTIALSGTGLTATHARLSTETASVNAVNPASISLQFGGDIAVTNGSLSAASTGAGAAGSVAIDAGGAVSLTSTDVRSSSVGTNVGPAGSVSITGNDLIITNGLVSTRTGNDAVDVDGPGAIDLISNRGVRLDGTTIETIATGLADAGDIDVQALAGNIDLDNRSLVTVSTAGGGDAGDVALTASADINLRGDSRVEARSTAAGDAGSVLLDATGAILIDGSAVSSESAGIGVGTAGDIDMTAQNITLRGALVSTQSSSDSSDPGDIDGPPGTIKLTTPGAVLMENGSLTSASVSGAANGGAILITANDLTLSQGSVIETRATGLGNSGSVALDIGNDLTLQTPGTATNPNQQSAILTNSLKSEGGDITANVNGVLFMQRGRIESSVQTAAGSGGDVRITTNGLFMAGSQVLARADQGNGGAIIIRRGTRVPDPATDTVFDGLYIIDSESLINADSNTGVDGEVNVDAPDADLTGVVEVVDARIAMDPTLADDVCSPTFREVQSSFIVEDEGGVAPAPDGYFSAGIATDAGTVSSASSAPGDVPLLIASAGGCP